MTYGLFKNVIPSGVSVDWHCFARRFARRFIVAVDRVMTSGKVKVSSHRWALEVGLLVGLVAK